MQATVSIMEKTLFCNKGASASMYKKTTNNITVTIKPKYLAHQSNPEDHQYVWAYHVCIENQGAQEVKLYHRHWQITDAYGNITEVEGQGVVGEQPSIPPGGMYEYMSGTPLRAPSGIMVGHYDMLLPDGQSVIVETPAFSLDSPHQLVAVN